MNVLSPFGMVSEEETLMEMIININKSSDKNKKELYKQMYKELDKKEIRVAKNVKQFFDKTDISIDMTYYREQWKEYYQKREQQKKEKLKKKREQKKQQNELKRTWDEIEEQYPKKEEALKEIILFLIQKIDRKEMNWKETVYSKSAGTIRKIYVAEFHEEILSFKMMLFKNGAGEERINIVLVREKNGKVVSQYNLPCKDEDIQILYNKIWLSACSFSKRKTNAEIKNLSLGQQKKEIQIKYSDFIIRTNLFQCSKKHLLEEIIGFLEIIIPTGKQVVEKVPCAYCKECNCFYMLESEYKRVAVKGVLLCQIITYEEYSKMGGKLNDFNWSSESILMRNGYNVKANKNLTDEQRQIILKNIIDNKILTPHGIVSYIDMFMAQKKGLPQYQNAVGKWERDKQFVLNYKNFEKREVEVQRIRRTDKKYY